MADVKCELQALVLLTCLNVDTLVMPVADLVVSVWPAGAGWMFAPLPQRCTVMGPPTSSGWKLGSSLHIP